MEGLDKIRNKLSAEQYQKLHRRMTGGGYGADSREGFDNGFTTTSFNNSNSFISNTDSDNSNKGTIDLTMEQSRDSNTPSNKSISNNSNKRKNNINNNNNQSAGSIFTSSNSNSNKKQRTNNSSRKTTSKNSNSNKKQTKNITPPNHNKFFMRRNTNSGGKKKNTNNNNNNSSRKKRGTSAEKELEKKLKQSESNLKTCQATILELRNRLHNQGSQITEANGKQQSELKQAGEHIKHLKEKLATADMKIMKRTKDAAEALQVVIRNAALDAKKEARRQLAADSFKYGRYVPSSTGLQVRHFWEDGALIVDTKNKLKEVSAEKEKADKRKKEISKRCKAARLKLAKNGGKRTSSSSSPNGSNSNNSDNLLLSNTNNNNQQNNRNNNMMAPPRPVNMNLDAIDIIVAEEAIAVEVATLKQQESKMNGEVDRVEGMKARYQKQCKRIMDEDGSRFCHLPCLNDRYQLTCLLGKGGFSEVWKCYDLISYCYKAIKIHQLSESWSENKRSNYVKHASRECEIQKELQNKYIVKQFDVFLIDDKKFATVLEYCDGEDLDYRLKTEKCLQEKEARSILLQILCGLKYLNTGKQKIIHYDLKPGNILFDKNGTAKITDFGLSKILDEQNDGTSMELTSQGAGTYWYLPPETFVRGPGIPAPKISSKVDTWSIGCMYYQMLYGKRPFGEGQSQENIIRQNIILHAHTVEFPTRHKYKISAEAKDFITQCLVHDQQFRPDIVKLCEHKYVTTQMKLK